MLQMKHYETEFNEKSVKEIYAAVLKKYGRVDILINNAATDDETGCDTIETITQNVIDDTFAVNVRGSILMKSIRWKSFINSNFYNSQIKLNLEGYA